MLDQAYEVSGTLARETGEMLWSCLRDTREIETKSASVDLVTEMDRKAERKLVQTLEEEFPDHDYIAEEGHLKESGAEHRWLIDPLDGTSNYAYGFPWFGVSMALQRKNQKSTWMTVLGSVYLPLTDELFQARKEEGAFINQREITVSDRKTLDMSMLATGFPYSKKETTRPIFQDFEDFTRASRSIRRAGAASIDLCYLAKGIFDGFWEVGLQPWDTAAGCFLIREAGGRTSDFSGNPHSVDHDETVASNGHIHEELIHVLQENR